MFRRHWSGLPADPVFPADLGELGYFIHESDEIREIEDPANYFKYRVNKNDRWNERRLFAMDEVTSKIITTRLTDLGLGPLRLPLDSQPADPHLSVYLTKNISAASRVVLVFGEPRHPFGYIATRTIRGEGGVNKGSMVGLTKALLQQISSSSDSSPPGVLLANTGELFWWPEGQRALTQESRQRIPLPSAVHNPRRENLTKNSIPKNRTPAEHIQYIFEEVLPAVLSKDVKLDVIAVGDGADEVEMYLNNDKVWNKIGRQMNSMAVMGGFYESKDIVCEGFKEFMRDRARAYVVNTQAELDTMIAGPRGNPDSPVFTMFGCPTYGAGENCNMIETILTHAQPPMLKWIQKVALEGDSYRNTEPDILGDGAGLSPEQMEQFMSKWNAAEEKHAKEGGPIINVQEKGAEEIVKTPESAVQEAAGIFPSAVASSDAKEGDDESAADVATDLKALEVTSSDTVSSDTKGDDESVTKAAKDLKALRVTVEDADEN